MCSGGAHDYYYDLLFLLAHTIIIIIFVLFPVRISWKKQEGGKHFQSVNCSFR